MADTIDVPDDVEGKNLDYLANEYISKRILQVFANAINVGSWCRAHPLYWNYATNRFERRRDPLSRLIWGCNVILNFLHSGFIFIRTIQTITASDADMGRTIVVCFFAALFTLPVSFQVAFIWFGGEELAHCLNQSFKLFRTFSKHTPTVVPKNRRLMEVKIVEPFVQFIFAQFMLIFVSQIGLNMLNPSLEIFASSLFYDESNPSLLVTFSSTGVTAVAMYLYTASAYMYALGGTTNRILHQALIAALGRSNHRDREAALLYQQLFLNNAQYNRTMGSFIFPMSENILIVTCTVGMVALVRFHTMEGLIMAGFGIMSYIILLMLLQGLANTDRRCQELKVRWARDCIVDRRTMKTLRPIRATLASYGYADSGLILTVTEVIVSNAINLLLAT